MNKDRTILNLMIIAVAFMVMVIIGDNVNRSLSTSANERENYARRKKYYEEVIAPKNLDLYPARYYIKIDR